MIKKMRLIFCCLIFVACGGSGSSTGPTPDPTPDPISDPTPTTPTIKDRSYTLSRLVVDSGPGPLELAPPQATGRLDMRANGAYTLSFSVVINLFVWEETVTGTHTFVGNTLRLSPVDSVKTAVVPFQQTLIIDNLSAVWQSESQVVIALPIRPGAWRAEDTVLLTYTQSAVASKLVKDELLSRVGFSQVVRELRTN